MKVAKMYCNCQDCGSHTLADCINIKCNCCDLEDAFAVISRQEAPDILIA